MVEQPNDGYRVEAGEITPIIVIKTQKPEIINCPILFRLLRAR